MSKTLLGHTLTPAFAVDSELLRYFPGHADAFQILLYGVYPVISCGLPCFLFEPLTSQCTACHGSLLSSIRITITIIIYSAYYRLGVFNILKLSRNLEEEEDRDKNTKIVNDSRGQRGTNCTY